MTTWKKQFIVIQSIHGSAVFCCRNNQAKENWISVKSMLLQPANTTDVCVFHSAWKTKKSVRNNWIYFSHTLYFMVTYNKFSTTVLINLAIFGGCFYVVPLTLVLVGQNINMVVLRKDFKERTSKPRYKYLTLRCTKIQNCSVYWYCCQ